MIAQAAMKNIWDPRIAIRNAIQKQRFAHAYLLYGPDSAYLQTIARWTSQLLLCEGAIKVRPCGDCKRCEKIARNSYPDLHWIEPQGTLRLIKIPQIRKLQQEVSLKPFDGEMKIVVLVEASAMNAEAANAFLKTLEEPPKKTVLLLLTTRLEKILPTVQSRCQVLRCYPEQSEDLSPSALGSGVHYKNILIELAGYNLDRAGLLVDSGLWDRRERILDCLGHALQSGDLMILGAVDELLKSLDDFQKQFEASLHELGLDLSDKTQEMEFKALVEGALNSEIRDILQTLLLFFKPHLISNKPLLWIRLVESIEETQVMLNRAGNRRLIFENLFLKMQQVLSEDVVMNLELLRGC